MLLHDQKTDENAIKSFFSDVHELYIKVIARRCRMDSVFAMTWTSSLSLGAAAQILMNPFHEKNSTITSKAFDERVKSLGEKYL